jgi:hypothetical protein
MLNFEVLNNLPVWLRAFDKIIFSDKFLCEYDCMTQTDFIYEMLGEMSKQCGGKGYFFRPDEEKDVLEGWVKCLGNFHPKQIIEAMDLILSGKYLKRDDVVPRTAMDFKWFMQNGTHNQIPEIYRPAPTNVLKLGYDKEAAREKSLGIAKTSLDNIRAMLPKPKKSFKQIQDEAGRTR